MNEMKISVDEEDVLMLESLVKSPAFAALKRTIDKQKKSWESSLLMADEPARLYRAQGMVLGLATIENLPGLLVQQKLEKEKRKERAQQIRANPEKLVVKP